MAEEGLEQRERDPAGLGAIIERHTGRAPARGALGRLVDLLLGPAAGN
ncbi:hypothetical protein ACWGIU_18325 [Streptomyces sp. NPDC054840]